MALRAAVWLEATSRATAAFAPLAVRRRPLRTAAQAMEVVASLGPVNEEERLADWGGRYSIYTLPQGSVGPSDPSRVALVQQAKRTDAVEIELAATAAYLFSKEGIGVRGEGNPWQETRRRKPGKAANGCLESAAKAYEELRKMKTARPLPELPAP